MSAAFDTPRGKTIRYTYRSDRWVVVFLGVALVLYAACNAVLLVATGSATAVEDCRDGAILLAIALFARWLYQAHTNLRALGTFDLHFSRDWCLSWFFIPWFNFRKPYELLGELWKASNPAASGTIWRWDEVGPALKTWWGAWLVSLVLYQQSIPVVVALAQLTSVVAAISTLVVVRTVHRFQGARAAAARQQLTREQVAAGTVVSPESGEIFTESLVFTSRRTRRNYAIGIGAAVVLVLVGAFLHQRYWDSNVRRFEPRVNLWLERMDAADYEGAADLMLPEPDAANVAHAKRIQDLQRIAAEVDSLLCDLSSKRLVDMSIEPAPGGPPNETATLTYEAVCEKGEATLNFEFTTFKESWRISGFWYELQ